MRRELGQWARPPSSGGSSSRRRRRSGSGSGSVKVEVEAGVVVSLSSLVASELTLCHLVIFCTELTRTQPPCLCLVPGLVCKIGTLPFPLPKIHGHILFLVMVTPRRPSAIAYAYRCIHLDRC